MPSGLSLQQAWLLLHFLHFSFLHLALFFFDLYLALQYVVLLHSSKTCCGVSPARLLMSLQVIGAGATGIGVGAGEGAAVGGTTGLGVGLSVGGDEIGIGVGLGVGLSVVGEGVGEGVGMGYITMRSSTVSDPDPMHTSAFTQSLGPMSFQ